MDYSTGILKGRSLRGTAKISSMYFLKISGLIPLNKQTEFEQTYRYMRTLIPAACSSYALTRDFSREDEYQFMSYWELKDTMEDFARTPAYKMLKGAFQTLGSLHEDKRGLIMESTTIGSEKGLDSA
jgi:quinol monooxygenase YgiN